MNSNARTLLVLGLIAAFIGLWLPYVFVDGPEGSLSLTYYGWSVLSFLNSNDTRFATGLGHLLPFLLVGLSYVATIVIVWRRPGLHLIQTAGFLVISGALLHLLLLGVGWASVYSPRIFDVQYWNEGTAPALGTYVSIGGIALYLVGMAGWTLEEYVARLSSAARE